MQPISPGRVIAGILVWAVGLTVGGRVLVESKDEGPSPAVRLLRFSVSGTRALDVVLPADSRIQRNDPVFIPDPETYLRRVGRVSDVSWRDGDRVARLRIYPEHAGLLREGCRAVCYEAPGTAAWVVATLVPPERLATIRDLVVRHFETDGRAIRDELWPELRIALVDLVKLYEKELPAALAAHDERWRAIAKRHREGTIREDLVPVLEEVTLASAREKFTPLLTEVGEELWNALPMWSLGWRAVWEKTGLSSEELVRKRFELYVEEEAAPIMAAHAGEAVKLAGQVVAESLEDPRVREALATVAKKISADPEVAELLKDLLNDLVVKNERLKALVQERWKAGLRDSVTRAAARLEPLIRRVVDSVILSEDRKRINPRLARVLRTKVFKKDGRWVRLEGGDGAPLPDGAVIEGSVGRE